MWGEIRQWKTTFDTLGAIRKLIDQQTPALRDIGDICSPELETEIRAERLTCGRIKTIMVSFWLEMAMPTTLTLKNIPDELYQRLRESAQGHRRSLNSEVLVRLESMLLPQTISVDERLARARQLRKALSGATFRAEDIVDLRQEGRA